MHSLGKCVFTPRPAAGYLPWASALQLWQSGRPESVGNIFLSTLHCHPEPSRECPACWVQRTLPPSVFDIFWATSSREGRREDGQRPGDVANHSDSRPGRSLRGLCAPRSRTPSSPLPHIRHAELCTTVCGPLRAAARWWLPPPLACRTEAARAAWEHSSCCMCWCGGLLRRPRRPRVPLAPPTPASPAIPIR